MSLTGRITKDDQRQPASIRILELSKSYSDTVAVAGIDLSISGGEFCTILGPSGSGKTTTLMMIAGFVTPTRGAIFIDDDDITRLAPQKRKLGIVFQNYALFPHMNVYNNITFPLVMRRLNNNRRLRRRNRLPQNFGTDEFRRIMGSFPTGVTVVTTRDKEGNDVGLTVNSVSSVSLVPPRLLVCLGVDKYTATVIRSSGAFAVNFLSSKQRWVAEKFASRADDKFNGVKITQGQLDLPLLTEALAVAECRLERLIDAGDHQIFIGSVHAGSKLGGNPLMYFNREFSAWRKKEEVK